MTLLANSRFIYQLFELAGVSNVLPPVVWKLRNEDDFLADSLRRGVYSTLQAVVSSVLVLEHMSDEEIRKVQNWGTHREVVEWKYAIWDGQAVMSDAVKSGMRAELRKFIRMVMRNRIPDLKQGGIDKLANERTDEVVWATRCYQFAINQLTRLEGLLWEDTVIE